MSSEIRETIEATLLLSDCDMEVEIREGIGRRKTVSFISQDGSRFALNLSGRDFEDLADFLWEADEDEDDDDDDDDDED